MISTYFLLSGLMYGALQISAAFYVIFILDIIGFAKYGILISASLVFQALVDFPSSVIADWLGRKFVLVLAYLMHAVSFFLLAFVSLVPDDLVIFYLFILFVIEALALAQESGALQSWFDTNYKIGTVGLDPKREHYRLIFGKTIIFIRFFGSFAVLFGGRIANVISREAVFIFQAGFMVTLALIFLFRFEERMVSQQSITPIALPRTSLKRFLTLLWGGIKLIFKSKLMIFFFITYIIITVVNFVWLTFIFIPLNYAYTGSDTRAALLYFSIFFSGSISTFIGVTISQRINITRSLPIIIALQAGLQYGLYAVLIYIYKIDLGESSFTSDFNLSAAFFFFLIAVFGLILNTIWLIASQRILIDIVPDENRNSFYSMLPSISLLLSSVVAFFVGRFIEVTGALSTTIIIFLVLPLCVAVVTSYLALRDYHEHEELHDPLFMYIAGTEDIGGSVSLMNLPKHWKSEKLIKKSWMKLMKVAEADGFVSTEEQKLLRQIISDLQSYTLLLEDALGDSLIDNEERKLLLTARKTLLQNAEVIGKMDNDISEDEIAIINKLKSIINQFEKAEATNYLKKKKKTTKKRRKRS